MISSGDISSGYAEYRGNKLAMVCPMASEKILIHCANHCELLLGSSYQNHWNNNLGGLP